MRDKHVSHRAECAITRSLALVGDSWSLLIVKEANAGVRRFGEFQKNIGLATNILSARLRKLVAGGVLTMEPASDGSPRKDYVVTLKGEKLYIVILAFWQWGEQFCFKPGELTCDLVDTKSLKPLQILEMRAQDGRVLRPSDLRPYNRRIRTRGRA